LRILNRDMRIRKDTGGAGVGTVSMILLCFLLGADLTMPNHLDRSSRKASKEKPLLSISKPHDHLPNLYLR